MRLKENRFKTKVKTDDEPVHGNVELALYSFFVYSRINRQSMIGFIHVITGNRKQEGYCINRANNPEIK